METSFVGSNPELQINPACFYRLHALGFHNKSCPLAKLDAREKAVWEMPCEPPRRAAYFGLPSSRNSTRVRSSRALGASD